LLEKQTNKQAQNMVRKNYRWRSMPVYTKEWV